jgi:hypothetical protein
MKEAKYLFDENYGLEKVCSFVKYRNIISGKQIVLPTNAKKEKNQKSSIPDAYYHRCICYRFSNDYFIPATSVC